MKESALGLAAPAVGLMVEDALAGWDEPVQKWVGDLKALAGIEFLREETLGREKLFVNVKLLDLLTHDEDGSDSQSP